MKKSFIFILLSTFLFFSPTAWAQYKPNNIHTAARTGDLKTLRTFVKKKPNQTTLNKALTAAMLGNQLKIMTYLIDHGADVNQKSALNIPLLNNAIMNNYFDEANLLIKNKANVNVRYYKTIHQNIRVDWNWTPLMCAARKGNIRIIKNLIEHGANVSELGWSKNTHENETSADIAAYSNHLPALKFLRKKGSPLHIQTLFKTTRAGHLNVLKYLIKTNPNFNINNRSGYQNRSLLLEAVWWGKLNIVKFLLETQSPHLEQTDKNGLGAIDYALKHKNMPMIKLLKNHGIYLTNKHFSELKIFSNF